MRAHDLSGQSFGRLRVVRHAASDDHGRARWHCVCECGGTIDTLGKSLRSGRTSSCGCLRREVSAANGRVVGAVTGVHNGRANATHGHSRVDDHSPTYRSWKSMRNRCTNPNSKDWDDYGGRGIQVCKRWESFENFLADMGERPEGKTLDRYPDNSGDYEPENCRWATPKEQQANRRSPARKAA